MEGGEENNSKQKKKKASEFLTKHFSLGPHYFLSLDIEKNSDE